MNKLEDKCVYWEISRKERNRDIASGKGKVYTKGFEEMGCYSCIGHNTECPSYMGKIELYGED